MASWHMRIVTFLLMASILPACALAADQSSPLEAGRRATVFVIAESPAGAGTGTGFCIDPSGIFITNDHVVTHKGKVVPKITVVVSPGTPAERKLPATVIKTHAERDIAILKVDRPGVLETVHLAPAVAVSRISETIPVMAMGFPWGEQLSAGRRAPEITVSTGKITAIRKNTQGQAVALQFDGSINPGNSGGPLMDETGQVIGVVYAIIVDARQLNLAKPVGFVWDMLNEANVTLTPRAMTDPLVAMEFIRWLSSDIPAGKTALPDAAAQKQNQELVRSLLAKSYADKTAAGRYNLLIELLGRAASTKDDPAGRYAMLCEARETAISSGEVVTALYVCSKITDSYAVNAAEIVKDTLTRALPKGPSQPQESAWVSAMGMMLAEAMALKEDYAEVRKLIPLIRSSGTASRNPAVMTQMRERVSRLEAQAAEFTKVQLMLEKLKSSPEDVEANTTVGKYRVFVRGDFESGLPMLAKGSDPALKAIALAELKNPTAADAQKTLGDQWWDLAAKLPLASDVCKARAANWYGKAEPNLSGLARAFVAQRMATLFEKSSDTPSTTTTPPSGGAKPPGSVGPSGNGMAGRWMKQNTKTIFEFAIDGTVMSPTTPSPKYKSGKWRSNQGRFVIVFDSGEEIVFTLMNENTIVGQNRNDWVLVRQ